MEWIFFVWISSIFINKLVCIGKLWIVKEGKNKWEIKYFLNFLFVDINKYIVYVIYNYIYIYEILFKYIFVNVFNLVIYYFFVNIF